MNSRDRELEMCTLPDRARLLRSIAKLPDPRGVAWRLPECALYALSLAEQSRTGEFRLRSGVRDMEAGQILFSAGLVEARGPYLSNFGRVVRKYAIALLLERDGA